MEQKYFIHDGTDKKGPYTLEELRLQDVRRYTLIWHSGLNNWTEADKLYELKSLFAMTPPPINLSKERHQPPSYQPQNYSTNYQNGRIEYLNDDTLKIHYENEIIHYRYASFGERLGARILDVLIIIIPSCLLPLFAGWLYYALLHSSNDQQTMGQKVVNIKLLSTDGMKVNFGQSTGRYFANILNNLTLFIGFLMFFFNRRNQCLHDNLASTVVVAELRRERKY
ncbi:RDD family protein [Chryseobacterium caseinilyticum]|uniref:RDD family protein n=1 Tax=Chryseobacterium caseinilyticum TaxID=2771428 RepID=A0ABR8Z9W2_9FLAO|nr:RDD family protein [Chryseobacterium caseinilyticum]MBD8082042.1 RDD family protein [Chryseobacterium caseinilyticum]